MTAILKTTDGKFLIVFGDASWNHTVANFKVVGHTVLELNCLFVKKKQNGGFVDNENGLGLIIIYYHIFIYYSIPTNNVLKHLTRIMQHHV